MPWRGGEFRMGLERLGRVISAEDTVAFWAEHDGCATTPTIEDLPNKDQGDNTVVRREVYSQCRGAEVVLYTIDRGGHTWPSGPQYLPQASVGRVSRDIDASAVIWNFFKRQARE
jgi:polyhydroxybutyrate depolymerase